MPKALPQRMCLGCRESRPKNELIRVVRTPEGKICLDERGKMSGRGAYICRSRACFEKAVRSKALERSLNTPVPDEIKQSIAEQLTDENT